MNFNKAFTLIEVVVSIVLLGLIMTFLYGAINNVSLSNNIVKDKQEKIVEYSKEINLLKEDIFNAYDINIISTGKYNVVFLETDNSLHGIDKPFVIWYVSTYHNALVRLESSEVITLPLAYTKDQLVYIDKIMDGIEKFKLYKSNDQEKVLFYIEDKKKKAIHEIKINPIAS
jgi:prepilin-type N-terminal cleavage/methylation domain-containing protein